MDASAAYIRVVDRENGHENPDRSEEGHISAAACGAYNEIAREFYAQHGYKSPVGFRFDRATHPQEKLMWTCACAAMEMLLATDPDDSVSNLEDEE